MLNILIDTCVWLDMAKNRKQEATLGVLEDLIRMGEIKLILPRTILVEFERNKERIVKEAGRSMSDLFKNVRKMIASHGDPERASLAIDVLDDVDHKIPGLGEAAVETIARIEALFDASEVIEIPDEIKLRAIERNIKVGSICEKQK